MLRRIAGFILWVGLASLMTHSVGRPAGAEESPGKTFFVEIESGFVRPDLLVISPGTTVVWESRSEKHVNVNFSQGLPVKRSCADATAFRPDAGNDPTLALAPGGSARLCFVTPGTYYYVAAPVGGLVFGVQPAIGTIIVSAF